MLLLYPVILQGIEYNSLLNELVVRKATGNSKTVSYALLE